MNKGETRRLPAVLRARTVPALVLVASALALSACMGAPTYGTGTPADEQLLEDLSGALSLAPKDRADIDYAPRPGIVMPPSREVLPPPQEKVTASSSQWPESPEQRLARVRADATAHQDDPNYDSGIVRDVKRDEDRPKQPRTRWTETEFQSQAKGVGKREAFDRRLAETKQGSPTRRRYLSEPPRVYRDPAPTAPSGDIGEDEWKKEREARRAARQSNPRGWRSLIPGL